MTASFHQASDMVGIRCLIQGTRERNLMKGRRSHKLANERSKVRSPAYIYAMQRSYPPTNPIVVLSWPHRRHFIGGYRRPLVCRAPKPARHLSPIALHTVYFALRSIYMMLSYSSRYCYHHFSKRSSWNVNTVTKRANKRVSAENSRLYVWIVRPCSIQYWQ